MASRNDLSVEFDTSPRVAEIAAPSAEIIMQDLVDTLRDAEYSWQGNTFKKLLNASGKEDLGGGVKVGITVAMQNLLLAFAGRTTPAETGTVTDASQVSPVTGRQIMIDSAALFQTANVQRGSLLINFSDHSIADVVSVESETQLTLKTLVNGLTNTYTNTDVYHVFNIVQVSATGGNLTAVDALQATIAAILPTAFTQVILTSSASATLAEQADIQFSSFGGGVSIDVLSPFSGTLFPNGTERQPVNNIPDAHAILTARGFNTFIIRGSITISGGIHPHIWVGESTVRTRMTLSAAADLTNAQFKNATITGTLDSNSVLVDCDIDTINFFNGKMLRCGFEAGTITLGGGVVAEMINCFSEVAGGDAQPIIDLGGSGQALLMRGYTGGIKLINRTGTDPVSLDLNSGHVVIDATCTAGTITVRGVGKLTDNSGPGCTVVNELVDGAQLQIMQKIMRNKMTTDPVTGIMTVFDDDGVTPLLKGNIYEDVLALQLYRGRGMERRERLRLGALLFSTEFTQEFD